MSKTKTRLESDDREITTKKGSAHVLVTKQRLRGLERRIDSWGGLMYALLSV
jgi:hypothetical protein